MLLLFFFFYLNVVASIFPSPKARTQRFLPLENVGIPWKWFENIVVNINGERKWRWSIDAFVSTKCHPINILPPLLCCDFLKLSIHFLTLKILLPISLLFHQTSRASFLHRVGIFSCICVRDAHRKREYTRSQFLFRISICACSFSMKSICIYLNGDLIPIGSIHKTQNVCMLTRNVGERKWGKKFIQNEQKKSDSYTPNHIFFSRPVQFFQRFFRHDTKKGRKK